MRYILALVLPAALAVAWQNPDEQLKKAGVCARCHVISVVEWGVSRHSRGTTNCISCHGPSSGHVIDERNNIKPDRIPRETAIGTLCLDCHRDGCPSSGQKAACQDCHHAHALVNPNDPPPSAAMPVESARRSARPNAAEGLPREMKVQGTDVTMILIRGGDTELGSDSVADARPVHTVRVRPFYLSAREVTEGQWRAVMGARSGAAVDPDLPAARVSWDDAQSFVRKLNSMSSGAAYRLPTEAEWEFAARSDGAAGAAFNLKAPRPASAGKPGVLGLYDMSGNLWEWCSSLARSYPYDPSDGRESPSATGPRILRGGGFNDMAEWVTPATRHSDRPDRRLPWYGFRIAQSVPVR